MLVLSLIWLSAKKRSMQKRMEMVINLSQGRDEDYRAARQGVREGERKEKRGVIRDGEQEGRSESLHTDKVVQLS